MVCDATYYYYVVQGVSRLVSPQLTLQGSFDEGFI